MRRLSYVDPPEYSLTFEKNMKFEINAYRYIHVEKIMSQKGTHKLGVDLQRSVVRLAYREEPTNSKKRLKRINQYKQISIDK